MTRPAEIAGVRALYRLAPHGSTILAVTPQIAWRFTDIGTYNYLPYNLDEFAFRDVPAIVRLFESNRRGGFVIITSSQIIYGQQTYGLPLNWGAQAEAALERSGHFRRVYVNSNTQILQYQKAP